MIPTGSDNDHPESSPPEESGGLPRRGPGFWARRLTDVYSVGAVGIARAGSWWGRRSGRWTAEGIEQRRAEVLPGDPPAHPIWIHAASMGEVRVGAYFAEALQERGYKLIASAMTETGFQLSGMIYPEGTVPFRVPFDLPGPMRRAFTHFGPRALVLIETEWWPNFLTQAARHQVPVFIVNGRLSEKAYRRYRMGALYWRSLLRAVQFFFMRTEEEAERLLALGVDRWRVGVAGSLKVPSISHTDSEWDAVLDRLDAMPSPLWIAGCTRPGEEKTVLEAFDGLREEFPTLRLWLAPRHPKRFEKVARLVARSRHESVRWSETTPVESGAPDVPIVLVDQMGLLAELYEQATVAFVGGSLRPFGGHNPLEPALAGAPVVFGPHMEDQRDAADLLIGMGMATEVSDEAGLQAAVAHELRNPRARNLRKTAAVDLRERLATVREEVADDLCTFLKSLSGEATPDVSPSDGGGDG